MTRRLALLLVILLNCALPTPGLASETLTTIRASESSTVYIDPVSVKHDGDNAYVWSIWDLASQQINVFDEPYWSVRIYNEYNCNNRTMRLLEVMEFSSPKGEGNPLRIHDGTDSAAKPIPQGSVAEEIYLQLCKNGVRKIRDF